MFLKANGVLSFGLFGMNRSMNWQYLGKKLPENYVIYKGSLLKMLSI
ncbi:hypothetical protein MARINOS108_11210 [Marinoscillum sp. 108]|nr:hypothetical protein MARINOS108_11210 [Marinoscillum sp. 108]